MTTPTPKITPLTDPDNVMWVVEMPAPAPTETVASVRRPKMATYATLIKTLTAAADPDFTEGEVKRDSKGRFAKKAGSKSAASPPSTTTPATPAPPAATSTSTGGKKMTNKVIYGKHPNGTIIASADGQHRMIFNAAGNNWTVQRRTPDGGWEVIDVLGKGAAYKKANELSALWQDPHDGTTEELTPVAAPAAPITGPFAPGWNDISGAGITPFKVLQILTSAKTQMPKPETMSADLMAQYIANIAQTYNVAPEHVVALMDEQRGDTLISDTMKEKLGGGPFPSSVYPTAAATKKAAATAKKAAAAVTPPTPTVAPAPTVAIPAKKTAKKTVAKTFSATNAPATQALNGEPFSLIDLTVQANASMKIANAHSQVLEAYANGDTALGDELADQLEVETHKYKEKYGTSWTPQHSVKVAEAYNKAVNPAIDPTPAPAPAISGPIPGANIGVGVGVKVKTISGTVGTVMGTGTLPNGNPGIQLQLPDGSSVIVPMSVPVKLSDAQAALVDTVPKPGTKVGSPPDEYTILDEVKADVTGMLFIKVSGPDGSILWLKPSEFDDMSETDPSLPAIGAEVSTPDGTGVVTNMAPSGTMAQVEFPGGATAMFNVNDLSVITPAPAPTATTSHAPGTAVSTMYGTGTVVSANPGGTYTINVSGGSSVTLPEGAISPITSATPVPTPPTPPAPPAMTYDANGVPQLTPAQQNDVHAQFQNAGVNWYNSSESLFDAAYAASQATGMSIEDVLKYADANFHNSSKDGGKPIQAKIAKWSKSSKGKAHIQAKLGTAAAAPVASTPPPASPGAAVPTPTPSSAPASTTSPDPSITGVPPLIQTQAFFQFTSGMMSLSDSPQALAQKAADVANSVGLTPEQVLKIVDEKKAAQAGVPNGSLFESKVMGHLAGNSFPTPTPTLPSVSPTGIPGVIGSTPFPPNPDYAILNESQATQLQYNMMVNSPPSWTNAQHSAVVSYTGGGYKAINRCLRLNKAFDCTPSVKGRIARATEAMRPTTEPITTFRGTELDMFGVSSVSELESMTGDVVRDLGFSSTSINPGSAFNGSVAMQIEIPPGTRGAYVANVSQFPGEREFVLAPGTRFRILEVVQDGSNARVRVEVVPA